MIKHHLTPDLMMAYSAGSLPEAYDLIIATHLSLCDSCRAEVESYDALGGQILEGAEAEPVSEASLSAVLAMIEVDPKELRSEAAQPADPVFPAPLAGYVGGGLADVKWRPVGMGVRQAILGTGPDATARLLYIPAGMAVPDHGHRGLEMTLVLQGAFEDEDGRFCRGDIEVVSEDVAHMPVADISEDCICLAVTDAPLRFKGLIPRIVQPFLKI